MQNNRHSQPISEYRHLRLAYNAQEYFNEGKHIDEEFCTMCGPNFCAMRLSHDLKKLQ